MQRRGMAMKADRRRLTKALLRPLSMVLVIGLLLTMVIPPLLDEGAPRGAIIGGLRDGPKDLLTPSGDGEVIEPRDRYEDFELGAEPSVIEMEVSGSDYVVRTDEYSITVAQDSDFVDYVIRPYFTDDVVRYRRVDPNVAREGTVDQGGNDLNWVSMSITDHGREGNRIWFVESCPQFSMRQEFTVYRDYFEFDTTYVPGESNAVVTYFAGLYDQDDRMIDLFSDGKVHRYMPGFAEDRPATHGIGGWYPSFEMFAPSFDIRAPRGDLGLEWGYSDEEAYLSAPIWMKGFGGGGPSTFGMKFSSKSSVLPDPARGEETTYHMFVRPYKYSDGRAIGHNHGYAKWVAAEIAERWTVHNTDIFPLTMNTLSTWDGDLLRWVEDSQITVAMQSADPGQINWHYKSAQLMVPHDSTMPSSWQLHNAPGQQMYSNSGHRIASAASPEYREHLIEGDPYNDWWWSSDGVFWDEVNVIDGSNNIRNDYNKKDEFVYTGFLRLVEESHSSGRFDYVITNPFTALLHLSMVSDLSLIEGYEPVPMYNNDLRAHTVSVMNFVNNMPFELRPRISVDQNYKAASDAWAVYSVLFGAARYGFDPNLRSYDPGAAQIPYLRMAEGMFLAMGADRTRGPQFWPATIDLRSEGNVIVTGRPMVVMTGVGDLDVEFTERSERYSLTNLWSAGRDLTIVLPADAIYRMNGLEQIGEAEYTADGKVVLHVTIAAGATGHIVQGDDAAATHSGDGIAFISYIATELRVRATGGQTTMRLGNLLPFHHYDVLGNGEEFITTCADEGGWISFTRTFEDEEIITLKEASPVAPEIVYISPSDGSRDVPLDARMIITFNIPVNQQALQRSLDPAIDGEWIWTDDNAVMFIPTTLLPSTMHTIEVGHLIGLNGAVNDTYTHFTFHTAAAPMFTVSGEVRSDGVPLSNVTVGLDSRITDTDRDGRFTFQDVEVGTHMLSVSREGHGHITRSIIVDGHLDLAMDLEAVRASQGTHAMEPLLGLTGAIALFLGLVSTGRAHDLRDATRAMLGGALHRLRER